MATVGLIQLDKIVHLRCTLESTGSQIKENEAPILIGKQKPLRCLGFQNRFIKRFIVTANKKLNVCEVPKTKDHTMDVTPHKLLYLRWLEYSGYQLSKALPFHSAGSQDCKTKVHQICDLAAAVALRLKPETLGPPSLHPPRDPSQNTSPEISVSFAIEQDSRKKKCPWRFCQILPYQLECPVSTLEGRLLRGLYPKLTGIQGVLLLRSPSNSLKEPRKN